VWLYKDANTSRVLVSLLIDFAPARMENNPFVHVQNVAQDVYENVTGDWKNILPYLSMYFCVHMFAEHVIPSIFPNPYKWTDGTGKVHPKQLAKLMRTRVISVLMAVWVCIECWRIKPEAAFLQDDLYGSTPATLTLTRVAVAHFIWDIVICILDGEQMSYQFHAWACFLVFACSLVRYIRCSAVSCRCCAHCIPPDLQRPFLHYMSIVVLFFEAGTPFLHIRQLMIKAHKTEIYGGIPFLLAQVRNRARLVLSAWTARHVYICLQMSFFSLFFYSRIWIGYYEC
jgi:hypothetical protein